MNITGTPVFGPKKIRWIYHCCLGFKDYYVGNDWLIDLSYHCMVGEDVTNSTRLIRIKRYLMNIPETVDVYVIRLDKIDYFIQNFTSYKSLEEFLNRTASPCSRHILDPNESEPAHLAVIESMINESVIFKV